jgi:hypothetical protein
MPTVRKIPGFPPPSPRSPRHATGQTFDERYPVLAPPPRVALDAAITAPAPGHRLTPGAVIVLEGGEHAVVLAVAPGGVRVYQPGIGERHVRPDSVRVVGKIPRVSRVANGRHGDAWLAKFYHEHKETSRHFAIRRYGELLGALAAAVAATATTWPDVSGGAERTMPRSGRAAG